EEALALRAPGSDGAPLRSRRGDGMAFEAERKLMVDRQIAARGVRDERVLEAMRRLPRHKFVPRAQEAQAYDDRPIAIGFGQSISEPYMVGRMTELLALSGTEKVLEIGAGSGYQTALLCELSRLVLAVEIVPDLAEGARERLHALGYRNFQLESFDGTNGWAEFAPYDAILVAAGRAARAGVPAGAAGRGRSPGDSRRGA